MSRRAGHRAPAVWALSSWSIALGALTFAVHAAGREHPGSPPLTDPSAWGSWISSREALDAAAGIGRLIALVLLGYLLVITLLQTLLAVRGPATARRLVSRATPRFLATLTAAAVASVGTVSAEESSSGATTEVAAQRPATEAGAGATMELLEDEPGTSLPWARDPHASPADPPAPAQEPPQVDAVPPETGQDTASEWVVRPGDHFWSIAEQVVTTPHGQPPSEGEVREYWVRLVEANRDRLVDPEDPDLIVPGQRLRLP